MENTNLFKRITSLVLAMFMVVSVVTVMPENVSAAEYSMGGSGTQTVTIPDEASYLATYDDAWIKFKPKATGYVTFSVTNASLVDNYTDGDWTLFDGSKKQISTVDPFNTSKDDAYYKTIYYGVQKNKIYYLRVKAYVGANITAKFTNVKEKTGAKKSKAKTIARGKDAKGVIVAGSKESDWYKFKVTKDQYLKISYSAKTNRGIKITVYEGKRNLGSVSPSYASTKKDSTYIVNAYTKKKTKVKAGTTYYVQVSRYDANSSGYYTVGWK